MFPASQGQPASEPNDEAQGLLRIPVSRHHAGQQIERDEIEERPVIHKSVPQGNHFHGLLQGGQQVLCSLFPGFVEDLRRHGAVQLRVGRDVAWYLPRRGVEFSSAVCVLIGGETWDGRWVKYEIARSVVDKKGLLAVHINGLNHVGTQAPSPRGYNPLHCLGIFHLPNGAYYLYEKVPDVIDPQRGTLGWRWVPYEDFKNPVSLPRYIPFVRHGYVTPLSAYLREYDFVAEVGHKNIGAWIDEAAIAVGR